MLNKNKKLFWLIVIFLVFYFGFGIMRTSQAQIFNIWAGLENCRDTGDCNLTDAETFFINLINLILKFLGVAALIMFIYGGVVWITSAGSPEKVKQGKNILVGAVTGICIVLFAYVLIYNVFNLLGAKQNPLQNENQGCFATWNPCPDLEGGGKWQPNCKEERVKEVQNRLNSFHCTDSNNKVLEADGCFGDNTQAALVKFQTKNTSCGQTDGVMDKTTYNFLTNGQNQQPCD